MAGNLDVLIRVLSRKFLALSFAPGSERGHSRVALISGPGNSSAVIVSGVGASAGEAVGDALRARRRYLTEELTTLTELEQALWNGTDKGAT
jgi:hypothetical protein